MGNSSSKQPARSVQGRTASASRTTKEVEKTLTCTVCDEKMPSNNKSASTDCKHPCNVCEFCIKRYLGEEVNGKGNALSINCLDGNCKAVFSFEAVRHYADASTFERYDNILLRQTLEAMEEFRWCGHGCGCGQVHANPGYAKLRCHACKKYTCFKHNCAWHENRSCAEYERDAKKSEEVALLQYLEGNGVRCPKCKHGIEKSGGCDCMTCRKPAGCGAVFCYRCGADYAGEEGIRKIGNKGHKPTCRYYS